MGLTLARCEGEWGGGENTPRTGDGRTTRSCESLCTAVLRAPSRSQLALPPPVPPSPRLPARRSRHVGNAATMRGLQSDGDAVGRGDGNSMIMAAAAAAEAAAVASAEVAAVASAAAAASAAAVDAAVVADRSSHGVRGRRPRQTLGTGTGRVLVARFRNAPPPPPSPNPATSHPPSVPIHRGHCPTVSRRLPAATGECCPPPSIHLPQYSRRWRVWRREQSGGGQRLRRQGWRRRHWRCTPRPPLFPSRVHVWVSPALPSLPPPPTRALSRSATETTWRRLLMYYPRRRPDGCGSVRTGAARRGVGCALKRHAPAACGSGGATRPSAHRAG